MNEMPTLTLIRHFKKYVAGDVTLEMTNPDFERFLTPERIGTRILTLIFVPSAKRAKIVHR